MSTTVTGRMTKEAREFQTKTGVGFNIRIGEKYWDRESNSDQWTNYEFAIFANNDKQTQIDFYRRAFVKGTVVAVTAEKSKVKVSECGQFQSIDLIYAKLTNVFLMDSAPAPQASQQQAPQQEAYQAPPPQQSYQSSHTTGKPAAKAPVPEMDSFDDDIPF